MAKRKALKTIPKFASEAEERAFWETHDTAEYLDWSQPRLGVFPDLKLSTETISLRLPAGLLAELKALANQRDVPYQSLLKVFLAERVAQERATRRGAMPKTPLQRTARALSRTARR